VCETAETVTRSYAEFLSKKLVTAPAEGFTVELTAPWLFDWQARIVEWALRRSKACVFADTGLGKTRMFLTWADQVARHTGGNVLVLAPLGVVQQTVAEGTRIGIPAIASRDGAVHRITVTNYERLHHFNPADFTAIVLDESSRIKNYDSKTRDEIIESFRRTPYKLACTATPAPNDHMELGNHAEFVGAMTRAEMLAMFFVHDGARTSQWRLKGHARRDFWRWVSTWAVALKKPSDLGYSDEGLQLPELSVTEHPIASGHVGESLFGVAVGINEERQARRASLEDRVAQAAELVAAEPDEAWVVWCDLNDESTALAAAIPGAIELTGSEDPDTKEAKLEAFTTGKVRVLVTKASIAGHGLNWQHCARTAFCGIGHSFELYYQAIRRFWRFGQQRSVHVHVIYSEAELGVIENLRRKEREAEEMTAGMVRFMTEHLDLTHFQPRQATTYEPGTEMELPEWLMC
jgi:superfamily II DNA or RNA helicase